ncbi:MAG: hypothetical protein ABWZ99_03850, partial [Ilumatobacteraceae bacterium]
MPARTPLPEGTVPVGIALLVAGIATYAFFKVGTVAVGGPDEFAPLSALWFATFALAPGLFLPLEQELGRAISHRRALNEGAHPVVRKVVLLGTLMLGLALLGIANSRPFLASAYFDGNWFMFLALAMAIPSSARPSISVPSSTTLRTTGCAPSLRARRCEMARPSSCSRGRK